MKIAVVWMWSGIKNAGAAVANVFVRLVSVLHTALAAIATFFREITLRDVWNGFVAFLHTLVVDGPKKIWAWMCKFEEVMVRAFRALWGCTGEIIYILLRLIVEVFIYVPKKVAVILWSFCLSIGKGFEEALIWINPKRC
ncbi:hypothetical protein EJ04DRAFT_515334 [Polyplosphaeria fusca]|uniref:Uncharacterized protein n=1 Tax=Polyplosphaeria fusca TaxID=682080 RepID=A0A9P4QMX5_9PLEO|nr:hypothetical protein EJ04DRAFT_515334 [Polyplosphaeria fusca]